MRNIIKCLFVAALLLSLTACAFVPEKVHLQPQIAPIPTKDIGHGQTVAVQVLDARGDTTLGGRATGYGPAASITLADNIQNTVLNALYQGLQDYGFKPIPYRDDVARKLTVHIISLNYKQQAGFWTAATIVNSTMEANAENKQKTYDRIYRAKRSSDIVITPTSGQDSQKINAVFSNTLNQMLQDQNLMNFLGK